MMRKDSIWWILLLKKNMKNIYNFLAKIYYCNEAMKNRVAIVQVKRDPLWR